ncbi:MAG: hypothetical protein ACC656_12805, partial [Candidatus Heimdallarchaeota archaeon]
YLADFPVTGAKDIVVSGSYAYIGTNNGLEILDVSSSLAPNKLSDLTFFTTGPKLFYAFPFIFSCDGTVGVNIINIADRTAPTKVTTFDTSLCIDIEVVGGYAYVADGTNGLLIVDISTIGTPVLTSTINVGGSVNSIAIDGSTAILGVKNVGGLDGIIAVDISDPTDSTPTITPITETNGGTETYSGPNDVVVQGSYAYVADWDTGVTAIDVSSALSLKIKQANFWNNLTASGRAHSIFAFGQYLFIAAGADGLVILDLRNPAALSLAEVGRYNPSGLITGVWVEKDLIYLA